MNVSADTLKTLSQVSTATMTSLLLGSHGMRSRTVQDVRPIVPGHCRFVGPAVTLRYAPAREDLDALASLAHPDNPARDLIDSMPAGGVLMIDMQGSVAGGALGDILVARLIARGAAGVVADGAMRDSGPLASMTVPVFCRMVTAPPSFNSLLAVDAQCPIGCGGVLVYPGDIVLADEDGVVVIPCHLAEALAAEGLEKERMEAWIKRRVEGGASIVGLYPPDANAVAEYRATATRT
jgi:regulator of RNase E activity RraA